MQTFFSAGTFSRISVRELYANEAHIVPFSKKSAASPLGFFERNGTSPRNLAQFVGVLEKNRDFLNPFAISQVNVKRLYQKNRKLELDKDLTREETRSSQSDLLRGESNDPLRVPCVKKQKNRTYKDMRFSR